MLESSPRIPVEIPDRRAGRPWQAVRRALRISRQRLRTIADRPDRRLLRRLRRLDLVRGRVAIDRLGGGITNHNFAVSAPGGKYMARLGEDLPLLGVDRRNEVACHRAAAELDLAPDLVYHEPGLLVSRFVEGRTMTASDLREPDRLARASALLRHLHQSRDELTGEFLSFCPFRASFTYARTAARLGAALPTGIDAVLEDALRLSRRIGPFRPSLCHNDLLPANWIDDGRRLWLVDWEYAGIGHPLFDLANLAATCGLEPDREADLLAAYRGPDAGPIDPVELDELRIFRAASLLREALWSEVQTVASDIDFDYRRYADENHEAYREYRARMEIPS